MSRSAAVREEVEAVSAVVADAISRSTDWPSLVDTGLLSLVVPADHGGEGLGLAELAVVLRAVGQHAVQLPVWETLLRRRADARGRWQRRPAGGAPAGRGQWRRRARRRAA